jgi:phage terminase large subunit-like protein
MDKYYDATIPEKVIKFFEKHLTLSRGKDANKKIKLLEWQKKQLIEPLYGWRLGDGSPLYRSVLLTTAKKQGKSLIVSFIAIERLILTDEPSPLVVLAAVNRKQASELFNDIVFAIESNEKLKEKVRIVPSQKSIYYKKNNGRLVCLSADAPGAGGLDCSTVIIDELALHPNPKLYDMLLYSQIARQNPLMILISNAGFDRSHFYYSIYKKAKEGIDERMLSIIHEVDENLDWKDERNWYKANPSLSDGIISIDEMRQSRDSAIKNPSEEILFRRYRLNQFVQKKEQYIRLDDWDECKGKIPDLSNSKCFVSVDLSSTLDLTSICALYPIGDKIYIKSYNFVPRKSLERLAQNTELYERFAYTSSLKLTEGACVDYAEVRKQIDDIEGDVISITFDKWNSLETANILRQDGYNVFNMPQLPSYFNEAMKKLSSVIAEKTIIHDGNECLRWSINNLQVKQDNQGRFFPSKSAEHLKIDPAVALLMCIYTWIATPTNDISIKKSKYEEQELFLF